MAGRAFLHDLGRNEIDRFQRSAFSIQLSAFGLSR
jgi:hypothetical protein